MPSPKLVVTPAVVLPLAVAPYPMLPVLVTPLITTLVPNQVRIPVDRDRAFRFNVTEDSEFA
jgi:hypothetical protein